MFTSEIIEDRAQVDGRRHVVERHTDRNGQHYDFRYMAEAATDVESIMTARAVSLYEQLQRDGEDKESSNGVWPD